jgi:DNA helicase-2/ATP-dependent DNA helicase PcrA
MDMKNGEWRQEEKWLQEVLKEIKKQFDENCDSKEGFKKEYIKTQREMWQDMGVVSITNGLDQIVDFMQATNTMVMKKREHEFTRSLEEKYEKMLVSPYFARMDFIENGQGEVEKCYIGTSNLMNEEFDLLIYDWRAPISSMFYDYEIGEANYKCLEGTINGKLTLKRQYKITNGKMEYMFDSNLKIEDEVLQDILGKSTDHKMKAIVTTIQREQNKAIRNEEYKNLIVQGPAGSGKTSIALHRIAYLLYKHREEIGPENIVIFSPNDIFNDYISNVLPQLGEDNIYQTTFKAYMHKALGDEFIKESYYQMMEYMLASKTETAYQKRMTTIKFKSSMEFISILKQYISYLENNNANFEDIMMKDKLIISSKDLEELFFKDYKQLPLKRRLQKIKDRILFLIEPYKKEWGEEVIKELNNSELYADEVEIKALSAKAVSDGMQDIYNQINKMTHFNLIDSYKNLFEKIELFSAKTNGKYNESEMSDIKSYTLENLKQGVLNYEDQAPLLYLKGAVGDLPKTSEIKYVIIDEAQDYTPLQYEIFYQLFKSAKMTILGDLHQSINPFMNLGEYENISHVFPKENTCMIHLNKSYRSTMEITKFSRRLLNKQLAAECVERSGEEPILRSFSDEEAIKVALVEDIKAYKEKGYQSIGVITRTLKEAKKVYDCIQDKMDIRLITNEEDEYVIDNLIIPAALAKGLEFDVVLIYNAGDDNYNCEEERLLLYTACTRALHVLCIYYSGKITPLLK